MDKKWKSKAEWSKHIPGFHQNQITEDTHDTKEQAKMQEARKKPKAER